MYAVMITLDHMWLLLWASDSAIVNAHEMWDHTFYMGNNTHRRTFFYWSIQQYN